MAAKKTRPIYGANDSAWILEIRHISETNWRRVTPTFMQAKLESIREAAREYLGGDCSIRAKHILTGMTVDLRG